MTFYDHFKEIDDLADWTLQEAPLLPAAKEQAAGIKMDERGKRMAVFCA